MRLHLDSAVKKALRTCAEELEALDADWAVAGATAMQVHGYTRATRDIDLFIGDDVRLALLSRLRDRAVPAKAIFSPHHYRIDPPRRKDPEASIDLLFPALGIESLGLLAAERATIEGIEMPVVPVHYLVALKLTTDPAIDPSRYARDQADLTALRDRGLVDATRVAQILDDVRDPEARARLTALVKGAEPARRTAKRRPSRRRDPGRDR